MSKILFIVHSSDRSGAPKVLLDLLRHLNKNHHYEIDLLVLNRGELFNEFSMLSNKVYYLPDLQRVRLRDKLLLKGQGKRDKYKIAKKIIQNNYNLIFGNTILSIEWIKIIKTLNPCIKSIIHIHESEYLCNILIEKDILLDGLRLSDKIIAVSEPVRDNLIFNLHVDENKILLVYPLIQEDKVTIKENEKTELRKSLGIGEDDFVLGTIGNPHLTKGTDLLPQIANVLHTKYPNLNFKIIIVGGKERNIFVENCKLDIKKLGLGEHFIFVPYTHKPLNYLSIFDLYCLTSREDSFSLALKDCASLKIPIITFDKNGGPSSIINDKLGFLVEYLNIIEFAKTIAWIRQNYDIAKLRTNSLDLFFMNQKYSCEKIAKIIKQMLY